MHRQRVAPALTLLAVLVAALSVLAAAPLPAAAAQPLAIGPPIVVDDAGDIPIPAPGDPQVGVFPDGGFVVVWTSTPPGGGKRVTRARLFGADGAAAGAAFRLVGGRREKVASAVAVDRDGTFLALWDDINWRYVSSVRGARFDRQGGLVAGPFQLSAAGARADSGRIGIDPAGGFGVAWNAEMPDPNPVIGFFADTHARSFDATGAPRGPEMVVAQGAPGLPIDAFARDVAVGADGSLWVLVDREDDGFAVLLRHRSISGNGLGDFDLSAPGSVNQRNAALGMAANGTLVAAWADQPQGGPPPFGGYQIRALRFGADGQALDQSAFLVNHRGENPDSPRVAVLPGGAFLAVWDNAGRGVERTGAGIFTRLFGADGAPVTRAFTLASFIPGAQFGPFAPAVALGGNTAVAVWIAPIPDGRRTIIARRVTLPALP